MMEKRLIESDKVSSRLISSLEQRDVVLWLSTTPSDVDEATLLRFVGLPWRLILAETFDQRLIEAVQSSASVDDPLIRKRGYIQVIDTDPSRVELPNRSLPLFLLAGRGPTSSSQTFADRLRRLTMLEAVRRSAPQEILIIGDGEDPVPAELRELWDSGFRCYLTFVTSQPAAKSKVREWIQNIEGVAAFSIIEVPSGAAVAQVVSEYHATYPEELHILRVRDAGGNLRKLDVTTLDEPERPILDIYGLIEERDLQPIAPDELDKSEFIGFFRDAASSWRPYAAGLPWIRDPQILRSLLTHLRKLDLAGPDENNILYIAAESGAGGTTLARLLAWECARLGYPALLARPIPFVPDALPVTNFLNRVHTVVHADQPSETFLNDVQVSTSAHSKPYEAPWLIVFDAIHWQYREGDLIRFRNEVARSGRPVCIIVVTGPLIPLGFLNANVIRLAELTHTLELQEAQDLGLHLNRFLKTYGQERSIAQWEHFYNEHRVRWVDSVAAFWVALSFWIQGQYDLSESIQEWMYRNFKQNTDDDVLKEAIVLVAALSSERIPMPERLLPQAQGGWPTSQLLLDRLSSLSSLGITRFSRDTEKYWSLVHDILGRLLVNALFYDFATRQSLGFGAATTAEHLRFLLLRRISRNELLGEGPYRAIGEDFATSIFKIDPDRGHGNFVGHWREVLDALDEMPRNLRDGSRLFRHHRGISRRRIATLDEHVYGISKEVQIKLLREAVEDFRYALEFIDYTPGGESNLNLYNSLANAYFDLAKAEASAGATPERLTELRNLGNDATRMAYVENPTNSFVIETYVKNLLQNARIDRIRAVEMCIEGLGIIFSVLAMNETGYRAAKLGSLADLLLSVLFSSRTPDIANRTPSNALDVLVQAWAALAPSGHLSEVALDEIPISNREEALLRLSDPAGRGNIQVIRWNYELFCANSPFAFTRQLELLEQLVATDYRLPAQLKLEYAILLFQNNRSVEGDRVFKELRRLWKETEQLVHIPDRLRWLLVLNSLSLRTVNATIGADMVIRPFARVQEFGGSLVPFRPEEFGFHGARSGIRFAAHVTFGHNGPFLRPPTAGRQARARGTNG
jgi:hypothetical protein